MVYSIAIDGPAGAGKSTVAKQVAKELGFHYVDTGAMYRAMAVYFLEQKIAAEDVAQINGACDSIQIEIAYEDDAQQVFLNGENITGRLRTEAVGNMTSKTAGYASVRKKLVELQQKLAENNNVVMDGRDIGTCVLPDATCKIYLTASVDTRAKRRYRELIEKGEPADLAAIKRDIAERDERDTQREISPLRQAEDAVFVDSSDLSIDEVTQKIVRLFRERI